MYDYGDMLLFAISASRRISWDGFKKFFDSLHRKRLQAEGREDDTYLALHRSQAIKVISSLAHVDVVWLDGEYELSVAPPMLASLPIVGLPRRAILCGARSPGTAALIKKACAAAGLTSTIQSQAKLSPYAPSRIEVTGESETCIDALAQTLHIPYANVAPAWSLVNFVGSLNEYIESLHWVSEPELNWFREDFDPGSLRFGIPSSDTASNSVRLSRFKDPVRSVWRYRLHRDSQVAEVDVNWGRYAVLSTLNNRLLRYDNAKRTTHVPRGVPLPGLFSRALSLCTGNASTFVRQDDLGNRLLDYEIYRNIPSILFHAINKKIGQEVS